MQHILGQVRRCVEDYHMIEAGDTVAVGVSGGKDSLLTLTALARLRDFYPIPFQLEAITLETGTPGMSFDAVAELCRELEVPYTRIHVPVYQIVFEERKEKNHALHIIERNTSNSPTIIRAFVSAILTARTEGLNINTDTVGELSKYLNLLGGTYILDCLPYDTIYNKTLAKARELAK